jgi:hypothetical protein
MIVSLIVVYEDRAHGHQPYHKEEEEGGKCHKFQPGCRLLGWDGSQVGGGGQKAQPRRGLLEITAASNELSEDLVQKARGRRCHHCL